MAIFPAGTENIVARHFKMPTDPKRIAELILHGTSLRHDVGVLNGRHFMIVCGVGFDARVVERLAAAFALVVAAALVVSIMFWRQAVRDRNSARHAQTVSEEQSREAQRQTVAAQAAEEKARQRFNDLRELGLTFVLGVDEQIRRLPGSASARLWAAEKGLAQLKALEPEAGDDVQFQIELAAAYISVGDVFGNTMTSSAGDLSRVLDSYRMPGPSKRVFHGTNGADTARGERRFLSPGTSQDAAQDSNGCSPLPRAPLARLWRCWQWCDV